MVTRPRRPRLGMSLSPGGQMFQRAIRHGKSEDSTSYPAVTEKRGLSRVLPFMFWLFSRLPHSIRAVLGSNPPRGDVSPSHPTP